MRYVWSLLFISIWYVCVRSKRIDCCQPEYSITGLGCVQDTVVGDLTYTCVKVSASCAGCQLNSTMLPGDSLSASSTCNRCCVTKPNICAVLPSVVTTSSWSKWNNFRSVYRLKLTLLYF